MTESIRPLIAGNWKMNGVSASLDEVRRLAQLLGGGGQRASIAICPPATLLSALSEIAGPAGVATGGQDCHARQSGAFTGDISAAMLKDAGASYVIVGHSERRTLHGETDELVREKAAAALAAALKPIICVGETLDEREAGEARTVVSRQVAGSLPEGGGALVIAYEPVWAIGTGLTPANADIEEMHRHIRSLLGGRAAATPILYGGSLKPANAREILSIPDVNGGLVGGASLIAEDFFAIISAVPE